MVCKLYRGELEFWSKSRSFPRFQVFSAVANTRCIKRSVEAKQFQIQLEELRSCVIRQNTMGGEWQQGPGTVAVLQFLHFCTMSCVFYSALHWWHYGSEALLRLRWSKGHCKGGFKLKQGSASHCGCNAAPSQNWATHGEAGRRWRSF